MTTEVGGEPGATTGGPLPLFLTPGQAQRFLGLGRDRFRNLVADGTIPSFEDEETGFRYFSRLRLEAWSLEVGPTYNRRRRAA